MSPMQLTGLEVSSRAPRISSASRSWLQDARVHLIVIPRRWPPGFVPIVRIHRLVESVSARVLHPFPLPRAPYKEQRGAGSPSATTSLGACRTLDPPENHEFLDEVHHFEGAPPSPPHTWPAQRLSCRCNDGRARPRTAVDLGARPRPQMRDHRRRALTQFLQRAAGGDGGDAGQGAVRLAAERCRRQDPRP